MNPFIARSSRQYIYSHTHIIIIGNDNFNCSLTGDIFYKFQQFSQQQQQQVFKKRVAQQMFEKDNLLNRNYRFLFFSHGRI